MEYINQEENSKKLIDNFIKKSVLVILNKRFKTQNMTIGNPFNHEFFTTEVEPLELDIEEIFSDEYSGIYCNNTHVYHSLFIFLKQKNHDNFLIEKWNFQLNNEKTDNHIDDKTIIYLKRKLITLMRSIYVLTKYLPCDSIMNSYNDYSIDYKLSSNIYNNESFIITPQKHLLQTDFSFSVELEYLTKSQINENIQRNKNIGKNKFSYRRPRCFSDNVEYNKKFEIINFDTTKIEDNYFLNKLNSKSKYEGCIANNLETIDSNENTIDNDSRMNNNNRTYNPYYSENYTIIYDNESDCSTGNDRKKSDKGAKNKNKILIEKESDIHSLNFSNQKKTFSEINKAQDKKLICLDDLFNNHNLNSQSNNTNQKINYNNNNTNLNNNINHTYRIRNKNKDFKEKNEMMINFIKNPNSLSNPENIMKFNKFNLKKYYQNKNRSKNKLVKINENSESETDSIKKIPIRNNKNSKYDNNNNSNYMIERIDDNDFNENLFENNNSSNVERENLQNSLKKMENKDEIYPASKFIGKDENNFKENIAFTNRKETNSNDSDYRDIIRLKNLNTNDTTSLKSSESSISKTNSFQLDYNSDNEDEFDHSVILSEDEKELLKNKTFNKDNFLLPKDNEIKIIERSADNSEKFLNLNDSDIENARFDEAITKQICNNNSNEKNKLTQAYINIKQDTNIDNNFSLDVFRQKFETLSFSLTKDFNFEFKNNTNNNLSFEEVEDNEILFDNDNKNSCTINFKIFMQFSEQTKEFLSKNHNNFND